MSIESSLQQKIDLARRELLDMGLRANPLLNFNSGTKSLSIVEESAGSIFEHLVRQKKSMRFLPMPEPHRQADNAEIRASSYHRCRNTFRKNTATVVSLIIICKPV